MRELCWELHTRPSPYIVSVIQKIADDPQPYAGAMIPPAGRDYETIYVSDDTWNRGKAAAEVMRVSLSSIVRVEIARALEEHSIPWDVTTPRPRNDRIPDLE